MGTNRLFGMAALLLLAASVAAQAPTGTLAGTVNDDSGAVVPGVTVHLTNRETGLRRSAVSAGDGEYSFPSIPAGDYLVRAEMKGFKVLELEASVETGSTTMALLKLQLGTAAEVVHVEAVSSQVSYDSHKLDGVVTRRQIESLPLNGRSFAQLAFLEPGVTVAPGSSAQYNSQFNVSVLGGESGRTSVNADGGNVRDRTTGNTSQNFSQEIVQEFQLSSANFDLSTGVTSVGSINIVTRSGGNQYHGSGYFFFRDHNLSAYPALRRDPLNLNPFFARRQSGYTIGGPIRKDRLFFFFNQEHNNQDSVFTVQPNAGSLARFASISPSPYTGNQLSGRVDYRINDRHTLFGRYTHDGNKTFGPNSSPPTLPSNWLVNTNWSDQAIVGLTSTLSSTLVNDFRFSYSYWENRNLFPGPSECPGCVALNLPQIVIAGTNFIAGNTQNAPQGRDYRTNQWTDNLTWQKGPHRIRFGGEWERDVTQGFWNFCDPACVTVWSPEITRQAAPSISLPATFSTTADLLRLPVLAMTVGFGDGSSPAPFQKENSVVNHRIRLFWQDSWRIKPRFTLNYGAAWAGETTLANHDLDKPAYLAPIIGGGNNLLPTNRDWNNIAPSLGFAWNVGRDNRTVVRMGAGIYYDTQYLWQRLNERNSIGPRGNGRTNVPGGSLLNTVTGIPGVPVGTPLDFASVPRAFTLGHFLEMLPRLGSQVGPQYQPNFSDLSVRGVNIAKSVSGFATIIPHDYPTQYGEHFNAGIQREIRRDLVVTADFVFRRFIHEQIGTTVDWNLWNSVPGPVIPRCRNAAEIGDVRANCSNGVIQVRTPGGRSNYKALLVKAEKRFANRFQFTASYALQARNGIPTDTVVNKRRWFDSYGPLGARNILNLSGIVELPWKFQFAFISATSDRTPASPIITGIDLDGDGTGYELLPGARIGSFNRGLGPNDLTRLVGDFNQKFAGTRTSRNQLVPTLRIPSSYAFGDGLSSQDIRLTKIFQYRERWKLAVFGEVFNLFNIANLAGYTYNLADPSSFGQPTVRTSQLFGSGGPRAFQFGARFSF